MRAYSPNSPQAAARVLAMVLLADGHYSSVELNTLLECKAPERLGLSPAELKEVIAGFAQDLLIASHGVWTGSGRMDSHSRKALLSEVTNPDLQAHVHTIAEAIVMADGHLAEGEWAMLDTMWRTWQEARQPEGEVLS